MTLFNKLVISFHWVLEKVRGQTEGSQAVFNLYLYGAIGSQGLHLLQVKNARNASVFQ